MSDTLNKTPDKIEYPYSGPEKRYLPRWDVNNRVLCRLPEEAESREGRCIDLSCSGLCMVLRQNLPGAERLKLIIYLTEAKAVEIEGRVVWNRLSGYGNLTGVCFENISLEIQDVILKHAFEFKKKDLLEHWFEGWNHTPPSKTAGENS